MQTLLEGTVDDIQRLIDLEYLPDIWDVLHLPEHIRAAWGELLGKDGR